MDTDDPVRNRALFLELIADVMFGVPSVIVSRDYRGEFSSGMGATHCPDLVSNLLTSEDRQMWKLLVVRPQSLVQKDFCLLSSWQ